ncbi:MAG: hemolysin family protein [Phycisphaerae bacterium]
MWWHLISMLGLIGLSAVASASETAFFSLTAHQRQQIVAGRARLGGYVAELSARPDRLLVTLLLFNVAVNTLYFATGSVLTLGLSHALSPPAAAAVGVLPVFALVVFGEVLPKMAALSRPARVAPLFAPLLWLVHRIVSPVGAVLNALFTTPALRLLVPPAPRDAAAVEHEELAAALEASARAGLIDRQTGLLLREVVEMKAVLVREVMVPRVDLKAFDLAEPRDEFVARVRATGLKRLPVYRDDIDHIIGVVEARQVLLAPERPIDSFLKPIHFVPEVIHVAHLLAEFRRSALTFAVVVDEYGGTAGFVTLEDLVEAIVGDIYDPIDRPQTPLEQLGADEWRVFGDLSIRDWARVFQLERLPHPVHTLAGLITALLGRAPRAGDRVRLRNLEFTVDEVQRRRVRWARVRREAPVDPAAGAAP